MTAFRMPLDVTVESRKRGRLTFRQGVVIHAPGAFAYKRPERPTTPPVNRYRVYEDDESRAIVEANTTSEAKAIVKSLLGFHHKGPLPPEFRIVFSKKLRSTASEIRAAEVAKEKSA